MPYSETKDWYFYATIMHLCGGWAYVRHRHAPCEILYVIKGEVWSTDGEQRWQCEAGSFLFHPSMAIHHEWIESTTRETQMGVLNFLWDGPYDGLPRLCRDHRGRILQMFRWLHKDRDLHYPGIRQYRDKLVKTILTEFQYLRSHRETPVVSKVRAYVRRRFAQPIQVSELAEVAQMSKFYFVRKYHELCGMSPMEDVRRMRVEEARRLIVATDMPLKMVASSIGLRSYQHLCHLLKDALGTSPGELRRMGRGET